ncbi:MAG: glycosyl transferase group 1 [Bacteroidetes bacterium]|nr:glycosyl transferase group 1 [Bacteroidota bacterium]
MPEDLKILFLNHSDTNGGAAKAAYRLFCGLRDKGLRVQMLVREKHSNDPDVFCCFDYNRTGWLGKMDRFIWKIKNRIQKEKWKKYPDREAAFLNDLNNISLQRALRQLDFDILHLHFVANRFLNLKELPKIGKPVVWTLHDCWPFTAICHYFDTCNRYQQQCGKCPMLHSTEEYDFTHTIWVQKKKIYGHLRMHIVPPSRWMGSCAEKSSLLSTFPVSVIPNCIDTDRYHPQNKEKIRIELGLNPSKTYILFGAYNAIEDIRKGYHLLLEALSLIHNNHTIDFELIIFGAEQLNQNDIPFQIHNFGVVNNESQLIRLYQAADAMVVPSLSENLSNTILESMACGTPVAAFNIGGNGDMIGHMENGYLATPFSTTDLADGICWCIENEKKITEMVRHKAEKHFSIERITQNYLQIYQTIAT